MKFLKRFNESVDNVKEVVEDLLRDFSDDEDIPVEVEIYKPDPLNSNEEIFLILIGSYELTKNKDLPVYDNIDNLITINDYLNGEGYRFVKSTFYIKHNQSLNRINITNFDEFISNIKEIDNFNSNYPIQSRNTTDFFWKTIKLVDIYYKRK